MDRNADRDLGMAKQAAGLTARQVETRKVPGFVADGGGLYLQVTPSGAKSWVLRFQIGGRRRDMGRVRQDGVNRGGD